MRNQKEKGVTLVSLTITIIIMLILAGVILSNTSSDTSLVNSSKEQKAETEELLIKETIKTDLAENPPATYSELLEILKSYGTITQVSGADILTTTDGSYKIAVTDLWNVNTVNVGLKVGTYVEYTASGTSYTIEGTYSGLSEDQVVSLGTSTLLCRVLSVDEENNEVSIIPVDGELSVVSFKGANGYNNITKILNDLCSSLFSNPTYNSSARNICIDDISKMADTTSLKTSLYGTKYTYSSVSYPVSISENEEGDSQSVYYTGSKKASSLTIMNNYYSGELTYSNEKAGEVIPSGNYFVASRAISANMELASYYIRTLNVSSSTDEETGDLIYSSILSGESLYNTQEEENTVSLQFLPIIILNTDNFTLSSGRGTSTEPYTIE